MSHPYPRIAAVDYGTHRVGLALTDPLRMFAQALGTFSSDEALARLKELHREHGLETIVVGWPLTEDGEEGVATRRVEPFLGRLRKALPGVAIEKQDERYSSRRAMEAMVAAGVKKKARKTKGHLDATAAALILQDYLEEVGGER